MIVTIDGPAGAGKSSVARQLARRLGFQFLDTGAMYRAVALAALRAGLGDGDADQIAELAEKLSLVFLGDRVLLNGADVTAQIRTSEVSAAVYLAADNPRVRARLVDLQRQIAGSQDTVTEGRDQGTVAFPHAECKIFLTASPEERARRRHAELTARGEKVSLAEVLAQQTERDRRDAIRPVGALVKAADAVEVLTDGLTSDEVVSRLERIVRERQLVPRLVSPDLSESPSMRYDAAMQKRQLTVEILQSEAAAFAEVESTYPEPTLYGVNNGKAIGTYLEQKFRAYLDVKYSFAPCSSALGIDFPDLNVDIKVTDIAQPQSSCPFKSPRQKIFGLGYSVLVFVYEKKDDPQTATAVLNFLHTVFVAEHRTADFTMTRLIRQHLEAGCNAEDLIGLMHDKNLWVDDIEASRIAEDLIRKPCEQGYLTVSNALQWRLQYKRVIVEAGKVEGILKLR